MSKTILIDEDEIVIKFCKKMIYKIKKRRNKYVPLGWLTMDTKRIVQLLKGEIEEYEENNSPDEAVDIGNYAMFLWYLSKK